MPAMRELAIVHLEKAKAQLDKFLDERGNSGRSKAKWYQEGEKSSKYFFNLEKSKMNKTEMNGIKVNGIVTTDPNKIDNAVETFYKSLYEKGNSKEINKDGLSNFLTYIKEISSDSIEMINSQVTAQELKKTLLTCKDSAPGPDGIPYSIIKLTWNYYGPLLLNSWKFALETGQLTHSHEKSYLKLIPKEGKDSMELKNWRPITLSNCDFKLITKTLAIRVTQGLSELIGPTQTAYIKNRQITDNLHLMQYMIEKVQDQNKEGMLISLDAEKAFDSIEHWYIKAVLEKSGLKSFTKIFDLLYKNQDVSIQLNQRQAGSYKIRNGVKQGDALSCILFILGIEPLLKNIENDDQITHIVIDDVRLPKTLSYADDVACITEPTPNNISRLFSHYEKMTNLSGLKLNAEKTEIIQSSGPQSYNISYNSSNHTISTSSMIKVNGLLLSFNCM